MEYQMPNPATAVERPARARRAGDAFRAMRVGSEWDGRGDARWERHRRRDGKGARGRRARLARAVRDPVATRGIGAGRRRHKELPEKEAADALQTRTAVCGGGTGFRLIAAPAAGHGRCPWRRTGSTACTRIWWPRPPTRPEARPPQAAQHADRGARRRAGAAADAGARVRLRP
ncbi:hypothetical protein GCM10023224_40990 [Streptomonospora halophila]|uniref:Uncharacterized protein n=1 Tax=Streptomonospora halophila TaxID=427369 RepID=A0ABP9H0L5_9ACTN